MLCIYVCGLRTYAEIWSNKGGTWIKSTKNINVKYYNVMVDSHSWADIITTLLRANLQNLPSLLHPHVYASYCPSQITSFCGR